MEGKKEIKWFQARNVLAVIGVAGFILLTSSFMGLLYFPEFAKIEDSESANKIYGMLGMIIGTWNSAFITIISFNFGSSQGSKDKSDVLGGVIKPGS